MLSPIRYSLPVKLLCSPPPTSHQSFSASKAETIILRLIIGIAFICSWNIGYAWADSLESALMPGQVIQGHAKWEEDCTKCHKRFDKAAQTRLCQDCHKDVREDIERKQRFHGRLTERRDCKDCHTDHKGRWENIVLLNESTFEHTRTNFALNGTHADPKKAECKACHKPKTKYRDAPSDCLACHKKDDYHKGLFNPKCETCHSETDWKTSPFNHDKDTKYPLLGKHRTTKCENCHKVPVAKEKTPATCYACHKKDDKHGGTLGRACESCHTEKDWKDTPSFDHEKTKFPLRGKHIDTKCKDCHPDQHYKQTPVDCYSCHKKKDDSHKGRFGARCESCHTDRRWKEIVFDHDRQTKYPLRDKHRGPTCESCHKGHLYKDKTLTACYACHRREDIHMGVFGESCDACHNEKGWKLSSFNHDRDTKYILFGRHAEVKCEDCHRAPLTKNTTPTACVACHKKDDLHKGQYGDQCESCHIAKSWKHSTFNHDRDTKYVLRDKHQSVQCQSCHKGHLYKDKTPESCQSCHSKDDVHKGQFGDRCEECHTEQKWKSVLFDHDRLAKFPLRGRHAMVACESCHTGHLYKDKVKTDCYACHKKDDKHKGQEGSKCETCHSEKQWREVVFDHETSAFPLRGTHDITPCRKCHQALTFKDAPSACIACHEKEDIHKRRLGTECQTCHNARDWKLWEFDHNTTTAFKLDGAHQKLDCSSCHRKPMGKFVVTANSCVACHKKDDKHDGGFGSQCNRCHVTVLWKTIKTGSGAFRGR
ncbi:MAG: cytochrome C [Nitrospiraceae bacterium]|nr:cytochrome C [Nitrospiraceae bacterium]